MHRRVYMQKELTRIQENYYYMSSHMQRNIKLGKQSNNKHITM